MRFQDKVAIVTGGASGIGAATVKSLAEEGAKVVIADFSDQGASYATQLKKEGLEATFIKTDVTNEQNVKNLISSAVEIYGEINLVVANAGIASDASIHELPFEKWKKTIDVNLDGVFLTDKFAIEQMLKQGNGGAIVNTGSIHSFVGKVGVTAYSAAKGGVKLLTQTLAATYAEKGIRVNSVNPGYIDTPLLKGVPEEFYNELVKLHPMGRLGQAEEVAKAILFLLSDDASFVVGTSLLVDGGYTSI